MNLFKKPKYLLMILLASITFVSVVPQFSSADDTQPTDAVLNSEAQHDNDDTTTPAPKADPNAVFNWLAERLGFIIYLITIKFPSLILQKEIEIFDLVGPYNGFTIQPQVVNAWGTVRDLANMFFILILLLMAFGTILQVQGYGYRQMLSKLLLMAILINFSKSIVAILIDFSQIVTLTFLAPVLASLAGSVVVAMGLQNIMNLDGTKKSPNSISYLMAMILGGIMMIITTVIMGVILIMFVMRIIGLWIVIILSPLAFLARAFPKMSSYYGQWEGELSKNLTTGPALAFFMWLAFSIVGQGTAHKDFTGTGAAGNVINYVNNSEADARQVNEELAGVSNADTKGNMLNFVIAISLLMAGLKFAAASGAAGASVAGKASGSLQKWGSRIGRGATIGAAAGVGALAWRGTSGEGGAKGALGMARGFTGKGVEGFGNAFQVGAWQRRGISMQAAESGRRQRKQTNFDKRFENMSDDQIKKYNETIAGSKLSFMGKREAKANLAKSELDGKASIDPARANTMLKELEKAGDYKAVEKLRSRSMAVNTPGSLEKMIADKGLDAVAKMNVKGITPAQIKVLLQQDTKALSGMIDKMDPSQKDGFMKDLDTHIKAGEVDHGTKAGIGDETSDLYKARLLQGKYDGNNADLHSDFTSTSIADSDRVKFAQALQKSSKAEDLVKIDGSSDLFKHVSVATAAADPSKANEMYNKAKTEEQRAAIVNSHVSVGNISNVINNPAIDKNLINEDKILEHFDTKIKAAMVGGVSRFDASSQLAQRTPNLAHLAFYDPGTKAVNYANFARYAKSLRFDELLKVETAELKKLISIGGLTPEQITLLKDKQGIT